MVTPVINSQLYSNPYQSLLYSSLEDRYALVKGDVSDALDELRRSGQALFHIHWEEALFRGCADKQAGRNRLRKFLQGLAEYKADGGKVIWTVHNAIPHDKGHHSSFFALRKQLGEAADCILLHNVASKAVLAKQIGSSCGSVKILPHPSYEGVYEPSDKEVDTSTAASAIDLLVFGRIKTYKKTHTLFGALDEDFLKRCRLNLRISGEASDGDRYLAKLQTLSTARTTVKLEPGRVPTDEVAEFLRSVLAVVIPYEEVLTSGVAVLCLTLGVPAIAPRTPQMLELFPETAHELLFDPSDPDDLRRAVQSAQAWTVDQRRSYLAQARLHASAISPFNISTRLGAIYDELLAAS